MCVRCTRHRLRDHRTTCACCIPGARPQSGRHRQERWYRHGSRRASRWSSVNFAAQPARNAVVLTYGRLLPGAADLQRAAKAHRPRAQHDAYSEPAWRCGIRQDGRPNARMLSEPRGAAVAAMPEWLTPEWEADPRVGACMTTRAGGVSVPPWHSMNLGLLSGDTPDAVQANRECFAEAIGATPVFLRQVHGERVVHLDAESARAPVEAADASWTSEPGWPARCWCPIACLCWWRPHGARGQCSSAGWRGLSAGVVERCVHAVCSAASCEPRELVAWLGVHRARCLRVGADVLGRSVSSRCCKQQSIPLPAARRWRPALACHLAGLACDRLAALGVQRVSGGTWCTVQDDSRFFSFRRDGSPAAWPPVWIRR